MHVNLEMLFYILVLGPLGKMRASFDHLMYLISVLSMLLTLMN